MIGPEAHARGLRTGPTGDLDVVFEDDALVIVNKPAGMLSVPLERNPGVPSAYVCSSSVSARTARGARLSFIG